MPNGGHGETNGGSKNIVVAGVVCVVIAERNALVNFGKEVQQLLAKCLNGSLRHQLGTRAKQDVDGS